MSRAQASLKVGRECVLRSGERTYVVEVLGMAKDTLWLSFPDTDPPRRGNAVQLEVHDEKGFATYRTKILVGPKLTGNGILVERLASLSYMKRRKDWRVPTDFPAWLTTARDEQRHEAVLVDLSYDGARLETREAFEPGEEVALSLKLPRRPTHRIEATVVYMTKPRRNGVRRVGLRFDSVSERGRHSLTRFLSKRIQELYPAELRALYPRSTRRQ